MLRMICGAFASDTQSGSAIAKAQQTHWSKTPRFLLANLTFYKTDTEDPSTEKVMIKLLRRLTVVQR